MNVHLTSVVTLISANLGLSGSTRAVFDVIVILFRTPVFVILAMLIFVYRLTPVPLNFSTPEEYRSSCERQEKEEKAYETARRQQKSQAAAPPQGEKRSVNVVTAISVDEYILKQINLLGWLMVALSVSEVLFTPRQTPMAVASVFPGMLLVLSTVAATIVSRVLFPAVFESSVEDSMWCVDSPAAIATVHDLPCLFFLLTTVVLSSEAVLFLHMSERVRSTLSILIPLLGCSTIRRNGIESVGATVFVLLAYYLYSNYSHNSDNTTLSMERTTRFCLFSLCYLVIVYIRAFFRVVDLVIGKEEERHVPVEQQLGAYK
ncbi:hypothetical protein AGDE_12572 [Angomonas deanei]|uniref:Transmembrane protein n=1 Tax=Angomonas deanei TaxID=59799 RepID=A0A7G2CB72_9TRYP|nr:hypothetical protein AGDE_12572 [Angomonas deanei]CAD2217028.1 hypothetical protein, conserved [Angomonas deanei]|eukprot:EPY24164.1 hypothetical protein AGDE_12572 [Angomonas deanei]